MTWALAWNIGKLVALIVGVIGFVTVIAKVWYSTAKDKLIEVLQDELKLARDHCDQCDKDVKHYREEVHAIRRECQGKLASSEAQTAFARDKLKEIEIENARLMAKTDLTPITNGLTEFISEHRKFTEEQTLINAQVLKALQDVAERLSRNGLKA